MKLDCLKGKFECTKNGIMMNAPKESDFFVIPENEKVLATASFSYWNIKGDFVLKAQVNHDFVSIYDACALMALDHERLWAKACFELSDFRTNTIVSVMTNNISDDANGVEIEDNTIWLQLIRKNNMFATYFSYDGITFKMSRLTYLPMKETIKVGFVAQSPLGKGGIRNFNHISLENKTVKNIRLGI